jgi:ATP-binding cassette subfamily C protein LapB
MQASPETHRTHARRAVLPLLVAACRDMPPAVAIASILINLMSLVLPLAVMQVYDRIIPRVALKTLGALALAIAAVVVLEALLRIARGHVVSWSATRLAWQVHRELLGRLMAMPDTTLDRESASRTLDRVQALMNYAEWHGSPSRLVLIDVPFVVLFLGLMALIGGWLAAIPVGLFLLLGLAALRRGDDLRRASAERATEDMKIRDFLIETLTGLTTVKAGAMEAQMLRRFERLQEGLAARTARIVRLGEEAQAFAGLLSNLTQMVTVTWGAVLVINGSLSVGTLACCVMLAGRAVQPLLRCIAVWNELQSVVVGLDKAGPLLELPPARGKTDTERPSGPLPISLRAVSLSRREGGALILDKVSLHVPAGTILAISGRDGAGKSTIVEALCGRITPVEGEILVGGCALPDERDLVKASIGLVQSTPATVRGTIIDNIAMYRRGDELDIAREAARLIGLEPDINKLPLGYDTPLGEGISAELPPGLIQRIVIARSIARRPGLLILDEANGALDLRADQLLARGLLRLRGHTTIVLITNRPSFAQIADQRLTLENGKLVAAEQPPLRKEAVA